MSGLDVLDVDDDPVLEEKYNVVGVGGALVGDGGCVGAVGAGDAGEGGFAVVGEVDGGGSGGVVGFVAGDLGVGEVEDEEQ